MRIVVTGSSGHLGEALVRVLGDEGNDVIGLDVIDSPFTSVVGSIADGACVRRSLEGADVVLHTATLHKPHIGSHGRQAFVDTNITGTLTLLEEAVSAGVSSFVFTSTTSVFGQALAPEVGAPATWVTEDLVPVPRNVYGLQSRRPKTSVNSSPVVKGCPVSSCAPPGSFRRGTISTRFGRPTRMPT
jgi:UDP-glucose 4-epimerase